MARRKRKALDRPRYPELKPCPFCGNPRPIHRQGATNKRVECETCGVQVRAPFDGEPENRQRARWEAADKWNTRRTPEEYYAHQEAEGVELEAELREWKAEELQAELWERNLEG